MANEIIKLIEYITNSIIFKGFAIGYLVGVLIMCALVIGIIVFTFKQFKRMNK